MSNVIRCCGAGKPTKKSWIRQALSILAPALITTVVLVQGYRFTSLREQAAANYARGDRILLSSPVPTISCDATGRIAMYNKSAEDVFGWTAEEMQGSPVERLIPEEARDQHRQAFQLAVDKLRSSDQTWAITKRRVPITGLRKSGEEAKLEMTIRGIRFGENEIEFIAVFRDTALPPAESRPFDVPLKPGS